MTVRTICLYPSAALREETEEVTEFDGELDALVADMWETMYDKEGIGLAAPQIGVAKKVIVIDYKDDKNVLVNPRVLSEEGSVTGEEGCLSFPGIYENVAAPEKMTVIYKDEKGAEHRRELEGFIARVFSHEIDHLKGRLIIDRVSPLRRQFMKKKIARRAAEEQ